MKYIEKFEKCFKAFHFKTSFVISFFLYKDLRPLDTPSDCAQAGSMLGLRPIKCSISGLMF